MLKSASKVTVINFLGATLELTQFPAGAIFCGTFLCQLNGRAERKVGTSTPLESLPASSRFTVYAGSRKRWNKARAESGTSEVELEQSSLMVINVRRSQCNSRRKKRARSSRKRLEDSASTFDACVCSYIFCAFVEGCWSLPETAVLADWLVCRGLYRTRNRIVPLVVCGVSKE